MQRRATPSSPLALGVLSAILAAVPAPLPAPAIVSLFANPALPLYQALAAPPSHASGGMVAFLDPETGRIGGMPAPVPLDFGSPAPEGLTMEDLVQEQLWDGSWMVDLRGLMQEYAVVRFDAKGRRVMSCGPDPRALLAAPAPAPKFEEE